MWSNYKLWKSSELERGNLNNKYKLMWKIIVLNNEKLFNNKLYAQDKMCSKEKMQIKIQKDLCGYYFYYTDLNF